ncbi:IDEAL domain-containing protein (plasmid) [Bacillus sp. PK9-021]
MSNEINRVESSISDEMLAKLFLDQVVKNSKKSKTLKGIDQSLKNKDKEAFLRLTEELKSES